MQLLGPGADAEPAILEEVEVRAFDVSTAVRDVAHTPGRRERAGFGWSTLMGART
jgi:hypothetical protein